MTLKQDKTKARFIDFSITDIYYIYMDDATHITAIFGHGIFLYEAFAADFHRQTTFNWPVRKMRGKWKGV